MSYYRSPNIDPELEHKNWRTLNIVFFDLETTDFPYIDKDGKKQGEQFDILTGEQHEPNPDFRIVQFYGIYYENGEAVETLDLLINPEIPIPPESTKIHGISDEDVKDASTILDCGVEIIDFLMKGDFISAFNGRFDQNCLQIMCERQELPVIDMLCLDLLAFERERRGKMSGNKLSDVAKRFGVAKMASVAHEKAHLHDAQTDVDVLADLTWAYAPLLPMTLGRMMKKQYILHKKHDTYFANKKQSKDKK